VAERLRRLEARGLFGRVPYSRRPLRWDYPLTNMGAAFRDVLAQMVRWEERWFPGAAADLAALVAGVATDLRCRACGDLVTARDVDLKLSRPQLLAMPDKQTQWRRSTLSGAARNQAPGPMAATLELFGDKWTIDVLICLFMRIGRFVDFRARTGISANILSDRLSRLTRLGVVRSYEAGYRLTERGVDLYGVLVTIEAWADAWLNDRYSSPVRLVHRSCGARFRPLTTGAP
jgi:DNA-binding HxlR family transcriptional regulator